MLRKMSLLAVSTLALTVAANAADLYGFKDAPYIPPEPWTGLYVGINAGAARASLTTRDVNGLTGVGSHTLSPDTAPFGGGTLGFNFQRGGFVFGVESDIGYLDLRGNDSYANVNPATVHVGAATVTYADVYRDEIEQGLYGDATARLGYALNHILLYGKGGFAFYNGEAIVPTTTSYSQTGTLPGGVAGSFPQYINHFRGTSVFTGWTAGGGLEYALNSVISLKAEYLHFDFGTDQSQVVRYTYPTVAGGAPSPSITSYRFDHSLTADSIKFGLNFHVQAPNPLPLK